MAPVTSGARNGRVETVSRRYVLLGLGGAGVLAVAGCLGDPDGTDDDANDVVDQPGEPGDDDAGDVGDETGDVDDDTDTDDTDTDDTDTNDTDTDDTDTDDDRWDFPDDPHQIVLEAGSFTHTEETRLADEDDGNQLTVLADLAGGRVYSLSEFTHENQLWVMESIRIDRWSYARITIDDEETFEVLEVGEVDPDVYLRLHVGTHWVLEDGEWSFEGEETFDGVPVQRYTSRQRLEFDTDEDQDPPMGDEEIDLDQEVLIDQDGIVRRRSTRWEVADADEHPLETESTLTAIGTTTVEDPDWLEDVISASDDA